MSPQSTAVARENTWNNPADDDPSVICCGAISNNDEKGVKAALLAGADANYEGPNGARPLALAAYVGNKAICVTLLSYGAEVTDICIQSAQAAGHTARAADQECRGAGHGLRGTEECGHVKLYPVSASFSRRRPDVEGCFQPKHPHPSC